MIVLSVEVLDGAQFGLTKSHFNQFKKEALQETLKYFHEELFPSRFTPGNESRQRHEKRNQVYKDKIKKRSGQGQGRFVDEVLTGKTKRRTTLAKITGTSNQATLTVDTPTYFRRPFVGSFHDQRSGRTKRVTRQPDKVAEIVQISDPEKEKMRAKLAEVLAEKAFLPKPTTRKVITG